VASWLPNFPPPLATTAEDVLTPNAVHEERRFRGPDDNEIIMSIFRRKQALENVSEQNRVGIFHTHGGGFYMGNRFLICAWILQMVEKFDVVGMSVEYRMAPAHKDPVLIEGCYAGLVWMAERAKEFGFDPGKIVVVGESAGVALAAGIALLARDRSGPRLMGQIISMPMLDDRSDTVSSHQQDKGGTWDRESNLAAWAGWDTWEIAGELTTCPSTQPQLVLLTCRDYLRPMSTPVMRKSFVARLWNMQKSSGTTECSVSFTSGLVAFTCSTSIVQQPIYPLRPMSQSCFGWRDL
jgi:acetyl esterase/lipase